jgi:hypothetical protein
MVRQVTGIGAKVGAECVFPSLTNATNQSMVPVLSLPGGRFGRKKMRDCDHL